MARLIAEGPPKRCAKCNAVKPRSEFYAQRHSNGRVYAQGYCIPCARGSQDEYKRDHPELRRRERENRKKDPERLAIHRDQQRESARRKRRRAGIPPRPRRQAVVPFGSAKKAPGRQVYKSIRPFVAWLETLGNSPEAIGKVIAMDPKQVRAYLKGDQRTMSLDVVERALRAADTDVSIDDLYPLEGS